MSLLSLQVYPLVMACIAGLGLYAAFNITARILGFSYAIKTETLNLLLSWLASAFQGISTKIVTLSEDDDGREQRNVKFPSQSMLLQLMTSFNEAMTHYQEMQ